MRDHVVIVNAPADQPAEYLRRLLDQLHSSHAGATTLQALVITEAFPDGMPPTLGSGPFTRLDTM